MTIFLYFINAVIIFFLFTNSNFVGKKLFLIDYPNSFRKKHLKPTPVVGGLFFFIFIFFYLLLDFSNVYNLNLNIFFKLNIQKIFFLFSFLFIFLIGILDDRVDLKPLTKIISYIFISYLLFLTIPDIAIKTIRISFYKNIDLYEFSIFFSILIFILFINSINMFDGINLQSSSLFLVVWTYIGINFGFSEIIINIIIFLLIFSYFNLKQKVFLGDCGIYLLSFLSFVYLSKIYNLPSSTVYFDEIICLFLLPLTDILRVVLVRVINGKSPLNADNIHFHHIIIKKNNFSFTIFLIVLGYLLPILFLKIFKINFILVLLFFLIYYFYFINFKQKKKLYFS
jgi:UDP-N-acetylmuramyl pentapeptide phosphotransferase/UDP-N-acetylglucosamine-1-phosphate transferase